MPALALTAPVSDTPHTPGLPRRDPNEPPRKDARGDGMLGGPRNYVDLDPGDLAAVPQPPHCGGLDATHVMITRPR
jgi:hypothetical protein